MKASRTEGIQYIIPLCILSVSLFQHYEVSPDHMITQSPIQNNINKQLIQENIHTSPTEVITGISRGFSKTKNQKKYTGQS